MSRLPVSDESKFLISSRRVSLPRLHRDDGSRLCHSCAPGRNPRSISNYVIDIKQLSTDPRHAVSVCVNLVRRTTIAPLPPPAALLSPFPGEEEAKKAGGERIGKRVCASKSSQYLCNRIASPYEESLLWVSEKKKSKRGRRERKRAVPRES